MCNIVELLEKQKLGSGTYRKKEVGFKALCGSKDEPTDEFSRYPLFAARFSPLPGFQDVLAVASEDGHVIVRNSSYVENSPGFIDSYRMVQAHNNAVFDLAWAEGAPRLVTASGDHSAALWDVGTSCVRRIMAFIGHTRSVRTVAASPSDTNVFASGSRDGCVMLWDCRSPRQCDNVQIEPDSIISNCHSPYLTESKSKGVESITSVVFVDSSTLATCVAGQGTICLWDLRRTYKMLKRRPAPRHLLHHPASESSLKGYSCLSLSPCRLRLYASCIDATIYSFDIGTFVKKPVFEYRGHSASSFYVKHSVSPCGRYLLSGSGDFNAYIWQLGRTDPIATLSGHTGEVTSATWALSHGLKMVTASEDGIYTIWEPHRQREDSQPPDPYACSVLAPSRYLFKPKTSCRLGCRKGSGGRGYSLGCSPVKAAVKQLRLEASPSKSYSSPTAGLPNYVIDGTSPSASSESRKKRPREDNWLTRLRKETPPPSKGTISVTPSPKRRHTVKSSRAKGNLFKFFCDRPKNSKIESEGSDHLPSLCCDNAV